MLRAALISLCLLLKLLGEVGSTVHIIGYVIYGLCDNAVVWLSGMGWRK